MKLHTIKNELITISWYEYLLVFMFAILGDFADSGLIPGKTYVFAFLCLSYLAKRRDERYFFPLIACVVSYISIGVAQRFYYGVISERALLALPLLIMSGYYIVQRLDYKFKYVLLHIMYLLSFVSLFFFFAMVVFNFIPHTPLSSSAYPGNVFLWVARHNEILRIRNCGPYWEPGAFGGYLVFTLLLFFNELGELWKSHRCEMIIILITILTTRSTQAYVALFMLFAMCYFKERISVKTILMGGLLIACTYVAYFTLPFLHEKISEQLELTEDWEDNNSLQSANRFTTTMLDMYYISQRPLIGNTDDNHIRYRDHEFILNIVDNQGIGGGYASGSGTTTMIACYGLIPFLIWLLLSYRNFNKQIGLKSTLSVLLIIMALGQGEQYSNAVFFLSLPFYIILNPRPA